MTAVNKVERYLADRKRPVTVKQIAVYFMYRPATINKALNELEQAGKATRTQERTWRISRVAVPPVAASTDAASQRPTHNRPAPKSYPNVRGYDD